MTSSAASARTRSAPSCAPSSSALRLLALISLLPAPLAAQATFTWTVVGTGDWSADGNWDQIGAPASLDAVIINNGGQASVTDSAAFAANVNVGFNTGAGSLIVGANGTLAIGQELEIGGYVDDDTYSTGTLTITGNAGVIVGAGAGIAEVFTNGTINIGAGGQSGTLNASEVALTNTATEGAVNAISATLRFDHTDNIAFAPIISGEGRVIKDGAGTATLTGASTYSGSTLVNAGTLIIGVAGQWQASTDFQVSGADTVLRIGADAIVTADLIVTDGTVEVAGTLADNPLESTFDGDATLHVLPAGAISDGYFTFTGQSSLTVDAGGSVAFGDFYFDDEATFNVTGAGAVAGGLYGFGGDRAVTLPAAGVVTAGYIELYNNVSTDLNQTGMILSFRDEENPSLDVEVALDLYDTAHATISAAAAVDSSAVTLWNSSTISITAAGGLHNSLLDIGDDAVVTLGVDNALDESGVYLSGNAAFVLNGYDVTLVDFAAAGGRLVNNSVDAATLTFDLCGCFPVVAYGDILADQDEAFAGSSGPLSLVINGGDPESVAAVFVGVQRHTGSTTVNGATLVVFGGAYDHDGLPETAPILGGFVSSAIILNMGSVLTGEGPVGAVDVNDASGIAPGDGVGYLFAGPIALSGSTFLQFDIADFAGGAGLGWDALAVDGEFSFSTGLGETFTVYVTSSNPDPDAVDNLAANFDPNQDQSLAILSASGGITGFSVAATAVDLTALENTYGGDWNLRVSLDGTTLFLDYTAAIPEPASTTTLVAGIAALALGGRRRRA